MLTLSALGLIKPSTQGVNVYPSTQRVNVSPFAYWVKLNPVPMGLILT